MAPTCSRLILDPDVTELVYSGREGDTRGGCLLSLGINPDTVIVLVGGKEPPG
jgi:hypothetical protein